MRPSPLTAGFLLVLSCTYAAGAEIESFPLPGQALPTTLFDLREMDLHLHAGLEREVGLREWIDLAVADGRKVLVLLDHIELYRNTPEQYAAWATERHFKQWYPTGAEGRRAFMNDLAMAAASRKDAIIFRGWEFGENELDEGLDTEPMIGADVIGWHISPNHKGQAPDGKLLLNRIRQIKEVQKQVPVPMIVFHPFSMRLEHLGAAAQNAGKDFAALPADELRFFTPAEQEEVIRELRGSSIYIEMAYGTQAYWNIPAAREALIADIKPLAEAGLQFTVSTDGHTVGAAKKPFTPDVYCAPCGITPQNTNTIVRELLALKAKRGLPGKD